MEETLEQRNSVRICSLIYSTLSSEGLFCRHLVIFSWFKDDLQGRLFFSEPTWKTFTNWLQLLLLLLFKTMVRYFKCNFSFRRSYYQQYFYINRKKVYPLWNGIFNYEYTDISHTIAHVIAHYLNHEERFLLIF